MPDVNALLERRARTWDQFQDVLGRAREASELDAESRQTLDRLEAELRTATEDLDRLTRAEGLERSAETIDRSQIATAGVGDPTEDRSKAYDEAFGAYVRHGRSEMTAEQRQALTEGRGDLKPDEVRALGIGSGAGGGYFVPQGFRRTIIETMKYYGATRAVAEIISTDTGNTLPWPTNDDTANVGAILAENTTLSQQDVVIGQTQLGAYMYTSKLVLVSYQLLQDSIFDVETFLARKLGERIGRIQNQHFTTGTGSSQPEGIQTNSGIGVTLPTGNTVTVTYAGLIDLIHSVDPAYRYGSQVNNSGGSGSGRFMLSDTALAAARKLVDSQQRPLWQPSLSEGLSDTLLGYGYVVNNDMPVPAASVKSILFGDFARGFVVRDVLGVQVVRLDERYADALQVGFFAFARSDSKQQDASAYKALKHSAT